MWHSLATWATGHYWQWEHPRCREYRDVISNGPFSIAIADTDRRGIEGGKNSQLSSVSVCASNDFRKCDLLSQAGCEEIHGLGFILPP